MSFRIRSNSRLATALGAERAAFLQFGLDAIVRILPHVETRGWNVEEGKCKTQATFRTAQKREIKIAVQVETSAGPWRVEGTMRRRKVANGVGAIARTIDVHERNLCDQTVGLIATTLAAVTADGLFSLALLRSTFDEQVIARHIAATHDVELDMAGWFGALRKLAEQTYENKALAFGCIVDTSDGTRPAGGCAFPADFLAPERKRYRALSDGYRTDAVQAVG